MAYIDKSYYDYVFHGTIIQDNEFQRLVEIASDIVSEVSMQDITEEDAVKDEVKKATAYQVEILYEHGGVNAALGYAELGESSESLGDYSVSSGNQTQKSVPTINGVPVSPMAIAQLRKAGLMNRWHYARSEDGES